MYSQLDEEDEILKYTPERGHFLDIGAFHPRVLSNTRLLVEYGWTGVVVEPSPGPLKSLIQEYGSENGPVTVVCAAVGGNGLVRMYVTDDAVTTDSERVHDLWKDEGGYYGIFYAPQISAAKLVTYFGPFDFINVDTEGSSVDILKDLLEVSPRRPACICVEHDNRSEEIDDLASKHGYSIVYGNGNNIILALK
jgi:FkbM family methyltransferase